jgi:hypothetical protein
VLNIRIPACSNSRLDVTLDAAGPDGLSATTYWVVVKGYGDVAGTVVLTVTEDK